MKILAIAFVYNELPYLPLAVDYYRKQGCELYVIDNMSKDGTWEWLQEQGIPSHRHDTQEAFQLAWLQEEMCKTIHLLKPDWFLWFAPDLFHVFTEQTVREAVEQAVKEGFNQIKAQCYSFKPTKEELFDLPLFMHFRYAHTPSKVLLCSKYDNTLRFSADTIVIQNPTIQRKGAIFEYGSCKPKEVQEEKLKRRQKAWELGTPKGHGTHYLVGKGKNWVYDKNSPDMYDVWGNLQLNNLIKTQLCTI